MLHALQYCRLVSVRKSWFSSIDGRYARSYSTDLIYKRFIKNNYNWLMGYLQLLRLSVLFCSSWNRSSELVVAGCVDTDVLDDGVAGQKGDVPRSQDDK